MNEAAGAIPARPFRTAVPYAELDLSPFADLPAPCWSPELFVLDELIAAVVDRGCLRILDELGEHDVDPRRVGFHRFLRRRLEDAGLRAEDGARAAPFPDDALAAAVAEHGAAAGSTFELIERVVSSGAAFLRGEVDGPAVLFARDAIELWERYFDEANAAYHPINLIAAEAASRAFAGRSDLRVLEVGGGCGSGAVALLDRLGDRIASYRFTEPFPSFLRRGRARVEERLGAASRERLQVSRVDLDRPLADQGVPPGSVDLVFAVNTVHVARDLDASLRELRRALAPGGALVLGEGVRPRPGLSVPIELVFALLPQDDAAGFRDGAAWRRALEGAGFGDVTFLPDLDAAVRVYPTYSMAGIIAKSEGSAAP